MKKNYLTLLVLLCLTSCASTPANSSFEVSQSNSSTQNSELISNNESLESEESISESISESASESQISEGSIFESYSESESSASEEPVIEERKDKNITNYISKEGDIPLINIYTNQNAVIDSKEIYTPGYLNIVEQPNEENVILPNTNMGIRIRGNSTADAPKKAFRIKFDQKTSLFNLPKAKSWVLLANYYDKSNLRNYLAYLTANKLSNLNFQPSSIMVEVRINNEYNGLYLLTEQMQTGKGRVDIEDQKDENGMPSFMLEVDFEDRAIQDGRIRDKDYFMFHNNCYVVKYPEGDALNSEVISYIKNKIYQFDNAIYSKSANLEQYMDVDSMIDTYFVQEMFKNVDVDSSSMYYYCEAGGKITAGPVWDFDIALNAVGPSDIDYTYEYYYNSTLWVKTKGGILSQLVTNRNYKNKINQRYVEIKDTLYTVFDELETAKEYSSKAQHRNVARWTLPGDLNTWIAQRFAREYSSFTTLQQHYDYLSNNLSKQLNDIDQEYTPR